jgi:hypothetical protein
VLALVAFRSLLVMLVEPRRGRGQAREREIVSMSGGFRAFRETLSTGWVEPPRL